MSDILERREASTEMREAAYREIRAAFESWCRAINWKVIDNDDDFRALESVLTSIQENINKRGGPLEIENPFAPYALAEYEWYTRISEELRGYLRSTWKVSFDQIFHHLDSIKFLRDTGIEKSYTLLRLLFKRCQGLHSPLWKSCLKFLGSDCNCLYLHIKVHKIEQINYDFESECFWEWDGGGNAHALAMDTLLCVYFSRELKNALVECVPNINRETVEQLFSILVILHDSNSEFVIKCSKELHEELKVNNNLTNVEQIFNFVLDKNGLYCSLSKQYGSMCALSFKSKIYQGKWDESRKNYLLIDSLDRLNDLKKVEGMVLDKYRIIPPKSWTYLVMSLGESTVLDIIPLLNDKNYQQLLEYVKLDQSRELRDMARTILGET